MGVSLSSSAAVFLTTLAPVYSFSPSGVLNTNNLLLSRGIFRAACQASVKEANSSSCSM